MARAKAKSIGETDESERFVTVEQFRKAMQVIEDKFSSLWNECLDIRMGKKIHDAALQDEKKLKIQ